MIEKLNKKNFLTKTLFSNLIKENKLSHAYLFIGGNDDIFSLLTFICSNILNKKVNIKENPNIINIEPLPKKTTITISQMRELKDAFSIKSNLPRIAIIKNADSMTEPAANSILKFIEEPFKNQYIFLASKKEKPILPTILSRVQKVILPKKTQQEIKTYLLNRGTKENISVFLSSICTSLNEAENILKNNYAVHLKQNTQNWLEKILSLDTSAFPYIQIKLMPLAYDKQHTLFLFKAISNLLQRSLEKTPNLFIAKMLDQWLINSAKKKYNLNTQIILETFVIQALQILKEKNGTKKFSNQ